MVPEGFHDFFVASAGVAGALIGLLFVAISVVPEGVGTGAASVMRTRPSAALSAFMIALLTSLLGLVPELRFGVAVMALGAAGLVTMLTLMVLLVREWRSAPLKALLPPAASTIGQAVVYGILVRLGLGLSDGPDAGRSTASIAVVVIVLFVLGIARAWEFVGASTPGLLTTLLHRGLGGDR